MRRPGNYPYPRDLKDVKGTEEYLKKLYNSLLQKDNSAEEAADVIDVSGRPWVYPEDYGAVGDGVTDDTTAIQAAIDAAVNGCVMLGKKTYAHSGLTIVNAVNIRGAGWDFNGSVLLNTAPGGTGISIANADYTGAVLSNLCLKGSAATGNAVDLVGEGQTTLQNVYILTCGGYGLDILNTGHTSIVRILNSRIQGAVSGGIFGQTEPSAQINGISIVDCEITSCAGDGILLWANSAIIERNVIQSCKAGVRLSADGQTTGETSMNGCRIVGNYFEDNEDGAIVAETEYNAVGPVVHTCSHLHIEDNYASLYAAQASVGTNAIVTFKGTAGITSYFQGLKIGRNHFTTDTLAWIDFGNVVFNYDCFESDLLGVNDFEDRYINIGTVGIIDHTVLSGAGSPTDAPSHRGQEYFDTDEKTFYRSCDDDVMEDWRPSVLQDDIHVNSVVLEPRSVSMVDNGSFSENTTGWTATDCSLDSVAGGSSGNCLQITRTGGAYQSAYYGRTTGIVPGILYTVSLSVKSGTSGNEGYSVDVYDEADNVVCTFSGTTSGSWVARTDTYTQPAGDTTIRVYLNKLSATAGTMLFDEVKIIQSSYLSVTDGVVAYSSDFAAGNACPTFRTENGTVCQINQDLVTTAGPTFDHLHLTTGPITVAGTQVIGARVVDARIDDTINSGDATTDGVIDAIRDALIAHGIIAAA